MKKQILILATLLLAGCSFPAFAIEKKENRKKTKISCKNKNSFLKKSNNSNNFKNNIINSNPAPINQKPLNPEPLIEYDSAPPIMFKMEKEEAKIEQNKNRKKDDTSIKNMSYEDFSKLVDSFSSSNKKEENLKEEEKPKIEEAKIEEEPKEEEEPKIDEKKLKEEDKPKIEEPIEQNVNKKSRKKKKNKNNKNNTSIKNMSYEDFSKLVDSFNSSNKKEEAKIEEENLKEEEKPKIEEPIEQNVNKKSRKKKKNKKNKKNTKKDDISIKNMPYEDFSKSVDSFSSSNKKEKPKIEEENLKEEEEPKTEEEQKRCFEKIISELNSLEKDYITIGNMLLDFIKKKDKSLKQILKEECSKINLLNEENNKKTNDLFKEKIKTPLNSFEKCGKFEYVNIIVKRLDDFARRYAYFDATIKFLGEEI